MCQGEVHLFWEGGSQHKSQRQLSRDAGYGHAEDVNLLNYYRLFAISLINIKVALILVLN